jgi:hypothetical protein
MRATPAEVNLISEGNVLSAGRPIDRLTAPLPGPRLCCDLGVALDDVIAVAQQLCHKGRWDFCGEALQRGVTRSEQVDAQAALAHGVSAFPRAFKAATSSRATALPRSPLRLGTPRVTRRVRDLQHVDVTDERTEAH